MSNETNKQYVIDQQKKRFSVLDFIWKNTRQQPQGSLNYSDAKDIANATGIYGEDLSTVLHYLESRGLIELFPYMGGLPYSRVTHSGIVEMENAITNPNQDTNYFSSGVIINFIETMNQTNISAQRDAIGNISSSEVNAPVTNTVSYSESDTSEILQAIAELRQQINTLAEENQDVAIDALDTLESEVKSPTKPTKVKTVLFSLWGVAQGVASFTNAVTAIADRFGVKFHQ